MNSDNLDYIIPALDPEIKVKAIAVLRQDLPDDSKIEIRNAMQESDMWYVSHHFYWGMAIRNLLRDKVCLDDKLPTRNWDDYYIECVEAAVGKDLEDVIDK